MIQHLVVQMRAAIAEHADRPATRIQVGDDWYIHIFREFGECIDEATQGLLNRGVRPDDRISLFASNCPERSKIDFGAATVRAIPVLTYATSTPEQIRHIAADFGLRVLLVSGRSKRECVLEVTGDPPELEHVVILEPWKGMLERVITYDNFRAEPEVRALGAHLVEAGPDDLASVTYTSGTTGDPKGMMLRHSAMIVQKEAIEEMFHFGSEDHSLCLLPLSRALERAWTSIIPLKGCTNTYVPDAHTVADALVQTKPTLLVSVPKLYEKVFATAHVKVAASGVKHGIFKWALRVGVRNQRAYRRGR